MGETKAITKKMRGKAKEVVAEIIGDGKLQDEGKAEQHEADQAKPEVGPIGKLNQLT